MPHRLRRSLAILSMLGACAGSVPSIARAQSEGRDPAGAEALFEAGRQAVEKSDYAAACPRFRESQRLDPAPGTLLNLADCEEHLGHLAGAWEVWKEAIATLPQGDARLPSATQRERAIESRVPRLTLTRGESAAADAIVVRRDDIEIHVGSFGVPLPLDPGPHTITVLAAGHDAKTTTIALSEGESRTFVLEAGPRALATPPPPAPPGPGPTESAAERSPSFPWRTVGLVTGAIGIVGLGVGGVFGALALGEKTTVSADCFGAKGCTQAGVDAARTGRTDAIASDVGFAAGGALLLTGALLYVTHPRAPATTGLAPSPMVLSHGGGVAVGGAF